MATLSQWVEGARPRTLPAALAPVLAGTAVAVHLDGAHWGMATLCFLVAFALQIGVNFANDYSDGVRGTDEARVGPMRLVGSGAASPRSVKLAAFTCFGVAAVFGLAVVALSGLWWLLAVGAAAIASAWFYTGGSHPYGYLGLGEVFVFIFFGIVAVCGTTLVQLGWVPAASWAAAVGIGSLACAILVANNLRDIPTDRAAGKRTLVTSLGDRGTRVFFTVLVAVAAVSVVVFAALTTWWALIALLGLFVLVRGLGALLGGAQGRSLIGVLKATGLAELGLGLGLLVGCFMG